MQYDVGIMLSSGSKSLRERAISCLKKYGFDGAEQSKSLANDVDFKYEDDLKDPGYSIKKFVKKLSGFQSENGGNVLQYTITANYGKRTALIIVNARSKKVTEYRTKK